MVDKVAAGRSVGAGVRGEAVLRGMPAGGGEAGGGAGRPPPGRCTGTAASRSRWPRPSTAAVLWAYMTCVACLGLPGAPATRTRHTAGVPPCLGPCTGQWGLGPQVTVAQGRLLGRTLVTTKGTAYDAFSGIPYAAPPVGDLRFKGPRPAASWDGVRDARREGRTCTQPLLNFTRVLTMRLPRSMEPLHLAEVPGLVRAQPWLLQAAVGILTSGEDCLFLNVYTPRAARSAGAPGLPVLFWVYGGGFVWGDSGLAYYDPDNLMDRGMVVVTFNYRLGPLGFLSLGRGSGAPGNAALKDQAAALRWVRDNIAQFGGDPNKVTIYGQSAGACSAHLHLLNEQSSSMLRGAIVASGTGVHWWATVSAAIAQRRARTLAPWLGCRADAAAADLVQCFKRAPALKLSRLQEKGLSEEEMRFWMGRVAFVPSVEEADDEADAWDAPFMTEDPRDLLAAGKTANVPLILGFNSGEALVLYTGLTRDPSSETLRLLHRDVARTVPDEVWERLSQDEAEHMGRSIRRFYFGDGDEEPTSPAMRRKFFQMASSFFMQKDLLMLSRYMAATARPGSAPVYLYNFDYIGALNLFKNLLRITSNETCHADELPYVWRMNLAPASRPLQPGDTEYRVRDTLTSLIADFIKTGSPTPPSSTLGLQWPAFTATEQAYLQIGARTQVKRDYHHETTAFWDDIFAKVLGGPIWSTLAELEARRRDAGPGAEDALDTNQVKRRSSSRRRDANQSDSGRGG